MSNWSVNHSLEHLRLLVQVVYGFLILDDRLFHMLNDAGISLLLIAEHVIDVFEHLFQFLVVFMQLNLAELHFLQVIFVRVVCFCSLHQNLLKTLQS